MKINPDILNDILRAPISPEKAREIYDFFSKFYDLIAQSHSESIRRALDKAEIKEGLTVLEVGFGTGQTLVELAKRVGDAGKVYGIDISPNMLEKARKRISKYGFSGRIDIRPGDARKLPYSDGMFDLVFSSYMFDLIDTPEIQTILLEIKRVLKPRGKLVLVNLTKGEDCYSMLVTKVWESVYKCCSSILGGCRPVLLKPHVEKLGFKNVERDFMLAGNIMPSEIILAQK